MISVSPAAENMAEFIEEVKAGQGVPLIKKEYFVPSDWRLFLRVLDFIAHYRKIAFYQGEPVVKVIKKKWVLLDPVGLCARLFLRLVSALGLSR